MAGNSTQSVAFLVRPKRVGRMAIKVSVTTTDGRSDSLERNLLVEHPGDIEYVSHGFLMLDNDGGQPINVSLRIPTNIIENSARIQIAAMGDLLASILENLQQQPRQELVHQAIGCGEQAMIRFLPNVLIIRYLQVVFHGWVFDFVVSLTNCCII